MAREIVFAFRADIRNLQRAVTRVEKELSKLSKAQRDAASSSKQTGEAMGGAAGKAGALGSAVTGVVMVFDKLVQVASVAGRVAAGALGAAGRAAADAVSTFARFEQTQLAINATLDTTAEQSRKVQNSIIGLGIKTQFTITAVQKAALALAQLGATDKDLEGLLKVGTDIATLTLGPLERETEILLKTMKAFGVEGKRQAEIFGTVFIQAHTKSAATVRKLGESLKSVGRIGRQFGNEIQDIVPAISKMIDEGQEAETTGIILRTVFTKLIAPTKEGEKALRKMGLSLAMVKPSKVNKLNDVLALLADRNLGVAAAAKIFGRRFAGQVVGLTDLAKRTDGAESKLDQFRRTLLDTDAAQRMVRRTQKGLQFELDQLNASWVAFKIQAGGVIARLLKMEGRFLNLRKRIGGVLEDLSKLSDDDLQEITIKILSPANLQKMWADALRTTLPAIGEVIKESFLIGVRLMLKFGSVTGELIGRALVRSAIGRMVAIGPAMARGFINFVAGGMSVIIARLGLQLASMAFLVDKFTGTNLTGKTLDKTRDALQGIQALRDKGTGAVTDTEKKLVDKLTKAILGEFSLQKSANLGEAFADAAIGKTAGRMANLGAKLETSLDSAAGFFKRNFEQPVAVFAAAIEKDRRSREQAAANMALQQGLHRVGARSGGSGTIDTLEAVLRDVARGRLAPEAFRKLIEQRTGRDPLQDPKVRALIEPFRRRKQLAGGGVPQEGGMVSGLETLNTTINRLLVEAGSTTEFATVFGNLAPLVEGLGKSNFVLGEDLKALQRALLDMPVKMQSSNEKVIVAMNQVRNALQVLAPGASPNAPGPRVIIGQQIINGSPRRDRTVGKGTGSKKNSAGTGAGNQGR